MIPQIIVTAWLTITWLVIAEQIAITLHWDNVDARILALIFVAIVVVALYFGNFWGCII